MMQVSPPRTTVESFSLSLVLVTALTIALFVRNVFTFDSLDEGLLASAAMKLVQGGLLYRDVFEFWPPGLMALSAVAFSFFGAKLWVLRLLLGFFILSTACTFYLLQRRLGYSALVSLASTLFFLIIDGVFVGLNNHWPAVLCLFLTMLLLARSEHATNTRIHFYTGVIAGLTTLFLQYEGAVAIVGSIIVLSTNPRGRRWPALRSFCAGALLLPLCTLGYFAAQGVATSFLYSTVTFPLLYYRGANGTMPTTLGFLQAILLIGILLSQRYVKQPPPARILTVFALILECVNLSSGNTSNVLLNSYFVNLLTLQWICSSLRRPSTSRARVVLVISLLLIAVLYGRALLTKYAVRVQWFLAATKPLKTPAGEIFMSPIMQKKISTVLQWLDRNPSRIVYFGPYAAYYYLLSGRPNPTPYSQLTSYYNTPQQFEEALEHLRRYGVDTILFLPNESPFLVAPDHPLAILVFSEYQKIVDLPESGWAGFSRWLPETEGIWQTADSSAVADEIMEN